MTKHVNLRFTATEAAEGAAFAFRSSAVRVNGYCRPAEAMRPWDFDFAMAMKVPRGAARSESSFIGNKIANFF